MRSTDDVEEIKFVLSLYGNYQRQEQKWLKEAFELQMQVDDMLYPKGINFEEKLGSSKDPKSTPAINMKQHELDYADRMAESYRMKYEALDEEYRIEQRFELIPDSHRVTLELVYLKKISYNKIADDEYISRQGVADRVKNAVASFMKV